MNDKELKQKVNNAMYELMETTGVMAPVDVMMNVGVLSKADYEKWRRGKVDYFERECNVNLRKLSTLMSEIPVFCPKERLKTLMDILPWLG